MDVIDKVFQDTFLIGNDKTLEPTFGTEDNAYVARWKCYCNAVLMATQTHFIEHYSMDVASRMTLHMQWFLSDECRNLHHRLPFPTATCLRVVGGRLLSSEVALTEVSGFIN